MNTCDIISDHLPLFPSHNSVINTLYKIKHKCHDNKISFTLSFHELNKLQQDIYHYSMMLYAALSPIFRSYRSSQSTYSLSLERLRFLDPSILPHIPLQMHFASTWYIQ
ncbi:hypothetical protein ACF0H5_014198 [Mactra antiquata]